MFEEFRSFGLGYGHTEVYVSDDACGIVAGEEVLSDFVFEFFFSDVAVFRLHVLVVRIVLLGEMIPLAGMRVCGLATLSGWPNSF